jgi:hypothetical protein
VDVFSYQLVHPNGLSDAANLYVRIDSPQATEVWSDTNYAAPATVVDAVNDVGFSHLTLANRVDTSSSTLGSLNLPVIGTARPPTPPRWPPIPRQTCRWWSTPPTC